MYYYNMAGQRFILPDRPLEPPDCLAEEEPGCDEEEYDRSGDDMNVRFNRLARKEGKNMTTDEAIQTLIAIERYPASIKGKDEACEMAIEAICNQEEAEKNDPLTLDELRKMDGKPVWAVLEIDGMSQIYAYAIVDSECECVKGLNCLLLFEDYGTWLAYRRPPKEKENE